MSASLKTHTFTHMYVETRQLMCCRNHEARASKHPFNFAEAVQTEELVREIATFLL